MEQIEENRKYVQSQTLETWVESAVPSSEVQVFLLDSKQEVWFLGHKVINALLAMTNDKSMV